VFGGGGGGGGIRCVNDGVDGNGYDDCAGEVDCLCDFRSYVRTESRKY
jgi:hypothetical protein